MSTDVNVKTLKINQLTEAQYDAAVEGGIIGANELSFITDATYTTTLPSQTGHAGDYLTTNGTDLSWGNIADPHRVIDFQEPTSNNNYTWYRKYADGWVEMGGKTSNFTNTNANSSDPKDVLFPVTMADTKYSIVLSFGIDTSLGNGSASGWSKRQCIANNIATTGFSFAQYGFDATAGTSVYGIWVVYGMMAQSAA